MSTLTIGWALQELHVCCQKVFKLASVNDSKSTALSRHAESLVQISVTVYVALVCFGDVNSRLASVLVKPTL